LNELARPAAPETAPEIASATAPQSPWTPAVIACVACVAVAGASLTYAQAVGFAFPNLVPVLLLASVCLAAVRWMRAGVRNELRGHAAGKVAEFGGGVYGAMAMATLLWLEGTDLVSDVAAAGSLGAFVDSLSWDWLMQQGMQSVSFAIRAGLWPWHWFSDYGMSAVLLAAGAAYGLDALLKAAFPRYRAHREAPSVPAMS
jgi:hypothetical protein